MLYIKSPVFFRWRAIRENARKGLREGTGNCWGSFQDVNLERQLPLGAFLRDKAILDFFGRRSWHQVFNPHTWTQKISYFHVFLRKGHRWLPAQQINIVFFGKKIPSFQIIRERSCPGPALFEKTFFLEGLKKISYFLVFFWKRSSFIFRLRLRPYFRERETWSFPIIRERSYSSAIFLERPSFQDVWKKKMWFSVQWQMFLFQSAKRP